MRKIILLLFIVMICNASDTLNILDFATPVCEDLECFKNYFFHCGGQKILPQKEDISLLVKVERYETLTKKQLRKVFQNVDSIFFIYSNSSKKDSIIDHSYIEDKFLLDLKKVFNSKIVSKTSTFKTLQHNRNLCIMIKRQESIGNLLAKAHLPYGLYTFIIKISLGKYTLSEYTFSVNTPFIAHVRNELPRNSTFYSELSNEILKTLINLGIIVKN